MKKLAANTSRIPTGMPTPRPTRVAVRVPDEEPCCAFGDCVDVDVGLDAVSLPTVVVGVPLLERELVCPSELVDDGTWIRLEYAAVTYASGSSAVNTRSLTVQQVVFVSDCCGQSAINPPR